MGIFDIFGTGDQRDAANAQIQGITAGLNSGNNYFGQGANALGTNYGTALQSLQGNYGTGASNLTQNYTAGLQPFQQNFAAGAGGVNALSDALGINGPQGNSRALTAFQNNPGYQFQQQQGDAAIQAFNQANGKGASGNDAIDLSKFNQNLANTSWGNYVASLNPYLGFATSGAQGIGNLYSGLGSNLGNLYQGLGNTTANVSTGLGNQLSSLFQQQGNMNYGANASIGNANANADLAGLNASANLWGLGTGLLGLGTGGGGTIGGSLFGMLSDERAKEDIEQVGELYDGSPVHRYRYKGDPRHQIGLIAQEVERRDPAAVIELAGWKHVDYRRATDRAAALSHFLKAAA